MHYFSGKECSEFLESMHYCIGILIKYGKYKYQLAIGVFLCSAAMGLIQHFVGITRFLTLTTRIPIFVLGMICAYEYSCSDKLSGGGSTLLCNTVTKILAVLSCTCLYLLYFYNQGYLLGELGMCWYPLYFIIPVLIVLICELFCVLDNVKNLWFIRRIFEYTGKNSLQIYLISVALSMILEKMISDEIVNRISLPYNLAVIILTYCITILYIKLESKLTNKA